MKSRGQWQYARNIGAKPYLECSRCGWEVYNYLGITNYCPSCGSRMDGHIDMSYEEARKVLSAYDMSEDNDDVMFKNAIRIAIELLDTVDKKAEWMHWTDDKKDYVSCSRCGYGEEGEILFNDRTNYCPLCGADMREEGIV